MAQQERPPFEIQCLQCWNIYQIKEVDQENGVIILACPQGCFSLAVSPVIDQPEAEFQEPLSEQPMQQQESQTETLPKPDNLPESSQQTQRSRKKRGT